MVRNVPSGSSWRNRRTLRLVGDVAPIVGDSGAGGALANATSAVSGESITVHIAGPDRASLGCQLGPAHGPCQNRRGSRCQRAGEAVHSPTLAPSGGRVVEAALDTLGL